MSVQLRASLLAIAVTFAACSETQPDCQGSAVACGGSCVELQSDNRNCGACGRACEAGTVCSEGACAVTCAAGLVECEGGCIDPDTDREHCGASGACSGASAGDTCAAGEVCSGGICQLSCQEGLVECAGTCLDPKTSRAHCGASGDCAGANAGTVCPSGHVCADGTCEPSCLPGQLLCDGRCVDPATDRAFCGASGDCAGANAGTACAAGRLCSAGTCVATCAAAQTACPVADPTYCADLTRASTDCGACGNACPAGQSCVASGGASACACPAATPDACSGAGGLAFCTDLDTDPGNCGACGRACEAGTVCAAGACVLTCSAAEATACPVAAPTYCVDVDTDASNCGACGAACPGGQRCAGGACACPAPTPDACTAAGGAGFCTDLDADGLNCGACGNACPAYTACSAGACEPLASCWELVAEDELAAAPAGSEVRNAPNGATTFTSAFGRPSFYVTSDWGLLRVPLALAGEAAFMVEVDVFTPGTLPFAAPGLSVFSDWGPPPAQRSRGVVKLLVDVPDADPLVGTMIWIDGDTCDGWGGTVCSPALLRTTTPIAPFADAWKTFRIEGVRATCTLRTSLDGVLLDTNEGGCDLTGGGVVLEGHRDTAFSRLRVYRGASAACVR